MLRPLVALLTVAAGGALSGRYLRRWVLTWGATRSEADARLPGDALLEGPDGVTTRAITIDAPASAVWPWIAQMGPAPRGGAYTYDWIENLLGLNMHSADTVLPEFQRPEIGDQLELGSSTMRVERVEPEHVLAWRSDDGNWVWSFTLQDLGGRTRLISRNRYRTPTLASRIGLAPMEPASLLMERRMLHGIRSRAERMAHEDPNTNKVTRVPLRRDGTRVHPALAAAAAAPPAYWIESYTLNSGRYIEMTMKPTIPPTSTIITGSRIDVSCLTAASTWSS